MCRIPKLVIVADEAKSAELRRTISSLEYDITAVVPSIDELEGITADVAVLWEPDSATISSVRDRGLKTVAIGGDEGADLQLTSEDAASLKTRVWELFRPN